MERTNYVAKAKSLMTSAARTTALVIVPLASAVSAHAGSVALPTTGFGCTASVVSGSGSAGSCSGGRAQLNDLGSGVQGISFYTSAGVEFGLSSGSASTFTLTMSAGDSFRSGSDVILPGTAIPLRAIFDLTPLADSTITNWNLLFALGTSASNSAYGSTFIDCGTCSGTTPIAVDVSSVLNVTSTIAGTDNLWETVTLTLFATGSETAVSSRVIVDVPNATSWDFQSVAAPTSPVPEPGTVVLIASGLALGAWFRRRQS